MYPAKSRDTHVCSGLGVNGETARCSFILTHLVLNRRQIQIGGDTSQLGSSYQAQIQLVVEAMASEHRDNEPMFYKAVHAGVNRLQDKLPGHISHLPVKIIEDVQGDDDGHDEQVKLPPQLLGHQVDLGL